MYLNHFQSTLQIRNTQNLSFDFCLLFNCSNKIFTLENHGYYMLVNSPVSIENGTCLFLLQGQCIEHCATTTGILLLAVLAKVSSFN